MKARARSRLLPAVLLVGAFACRRDKAGAGVDPDAGVHPTVGTVDAVAIERAVDRRAPAELAALYAAADGIARDVATRRRVARGYARIGGEAAFTALLPMLADEDPTVVAWASYGLGFSCKGHEAELVRALVARGETLREGSGAGARAVAIDTPSPSFALPRALGRCGGALAERTLAGWVLARGPFAEAAAFALGELAQKQGTLSAETVTSLLDAATARVGATASRTRAPLQPFSRMKSVPDAFAPRLVEVARAALAEPAPDRVFAVRALAKTQGKATPVLAPIVSDPSFTVAERVEAARGLAAAEGEEAANALGGALVALAAQSGATKTMVTSGEIHVVLTVVDALADLAIESGPPEPARKVLYNLAALPPPAAAPAPDALRVTTLRCHAAAALARTDSSAEVLTRCAAAGSVPRERAELHALLKAKTPRGAAPSLVGARLTAFARLARSENLAVRESALEALGAHAELGPLARTLAAEALATKKPGLVATVADAITQSPARFVRDGGVGLAPELAASFDAALAEPWAPDLVETRVALVDAAVAAQHARAKELALAACHDENLTVRQRGEKALATLGTRDADCARKPGAPAKELDALLTNAVRIRFDIAGRALGIRLDPGAAPVTSTRLATLARAGFYKGVVVHRVVPGFVVQLGDPGADGYGGSGTPLRCETSPLPFAPGSVGMALAGRDTGSSQLFVTLARTPHLDGDYAAVGRADGEWDAIVEGDVIDGVTVEDAP